MIELLDSLGVDGILLGLLTFIIIGCFHPIVVKSEYYFGYGCWWVFLLIGIFSLGAACFVQELFYSALLSLVGFSCLWSIIELKEQYHRVRKGWFPKNPKRHYDFDDKPQNK